MTTAQVVETSVTVNNNSPIQDYVHPHDLTQPTIKALGWTGNKKCTGFTTVQQKELKSDAVHFTDPNQTC